MRTPTRFPAFFSPLLASALVFSASHSARAGTDTWTGSSSLNFSDPGNWSPAAAPVAGDSLVFGSAGATTLNNDLTALTAIDGFTFAGGSAFTLNGSSVLISGVATNNQFGVLNNSGLIQTFGTLNLTLDRGYFTFSSPSGGNIALNGGLTLNPGGVAYFDTSVTSSSLSPDATTGLITGLEGNGLIYDTSVTPTGLASISGGAIVPYAGYTSLAGGATAATATAISSGNNLNLTDTGSSVFFTNTTSTIYSLSVAQAGNGAATATTTLNNSGTLTLGQHGGVYLLNSAAGSRADFSLAGGTLTAGSSGAASINFAVNGNNQSNQLSCSATIVNNAGSGAVSVIKTGTGAMNFATTTTSSYTGGVYVDQGQLQFGQVQQLGTGPVYVSSAGTLYFSGTGTITNPITLSPGPGANTVSAVAGGAGYIASGASGTLIGTVTLSGSPVTTPPVGTVGTVTGDAFNCDATGGAYTWTGQITGTGTFQVTGAHTSTLTLNNTTNAANNWQGGTIVGGHGGSAVNIDLKMGANNQMPTGANANYLSLNSALTGIYARFDLNGTTQTIGSLFGSSSVSNEIDNFAASAAATLTLGANDGTGATFTGSTHDSAASPINFIKIGTGIQTFNGTSQGAGTSTFGYHGNTTVSNGTLAFTGSAIPSNSPVFTVTAPATLDASGNNNGGLVLGSSQILAGLGTVVGSTAIGGTVKPFLGTIGSLTNNNGTVSLNGGGSYNWYINNANGTAGSDPGWSLLNIQNGGLSVNSSAGSQFTINIISLTSGDVAGNALNFNSGVSSNWVIATTSSGIFGYTGTSQFAVNTSAFSNSPSSSSKWSVGVSNNNLVLFYTSAPVITTPLVNQTNIAGTTATYTVTANGATIPVTFNWFQNGNQLSDGGNSASGGGVGISVVGKTSTLTITNVQDADTNGGISVNVSDNVGDSGSSAASLTVIDPPSSPTITQSISDGKSAGGIVGLNASANGSAPFTFSWSLNGVPLTNSSTIKGVGTAALSVYLSQALTGTYTVVIANAAGSATNTYVLGPISMVPNQIIYEPFTSYTAETPPPFPSDNIDGQTNLFNQLTGNPAFWFHSSGSGNQIGVVLNDLANGNNNRNGGTYPWPGLAGTSSNELYWTTSLNSHLEFGQIESFPPGTKVYCSFTLSCDQGSALTVTNDVLAGFTTSDSGTAFNLKVCSMISSANSSASQYVLGIAKANGVGSAQGVDANTLWEPNPTAVGQDVLVVVCYTVVSGGNVATDDTVSMWVNPNPSSYYASEASVPAPDVGPASFGVANSVIRDFALHSVTSPASHRMTDLRIGTTWASVTPASGPTMYLGNVAAPVGTTATLASGNAGNPVVNYGWQFNNGAALTDGPTGHGSTISGSSTGTLVIANVQSADYGTYTVNGTNSDPITSATLTGSASGLLTPLPPKLSATLSGANVVIAWPTNWLGYRLQQTSNLDIPRNWTTQSSAPYPVIGTNNAVTVPNSGSKFYRLINP